MTLTPGQQVFLGFLSGIGSGFLVRAIVSPSSSRDLSPAALVNPEAVSPLASQFSQDEALFVLDAWDAVGRNIRYSGYGSNLVFEDFYIRCEKCSLPVETLKAGQANCVGKAALLASLLRTRLPADSVYMVVGELVLNEVGGHAWTEVVLGGERYILESTMPPPDDNPWVSAADAADIYIPKAYFNDQSLSCATGLCVPISGARCNCLLTSPRPASILVAK